jgi:hypothetical protein
MKNLWKKIPKLRLNKLAGNFTLALLILFSFFTFGCQPPVEPNEEPPFGSKSANITPTPKVELTDFESELKSMRIADFYHIYTLKRKDGAAFESSDKTFVKENIHYATNRTSFIKDDTILFIGTNYEPTEENIDALKERFEFEDFSKPREQIEKEKAEKQAERDKLKKEMEEANQNRPDQNENS